MFVSLFCLTFCDHLKFLSTVVICGIPLWRRSFTEMVYSFFKDRFQIRPNHIFNVGIVLEGLKYVVNVEALVTRSTTRDSTPRDALLPTKIRSSFRGRGVNVNKTEPGQHNLPEILLFHGNVITTTIHQE